MIRWDAITRVYGMAAQTGTHLALLSYTLTSGASRGPPKRPSPPGACRSKTGPSGGADPVPPPRLTSGLRLVLVPRPESGKGAAVWGRSWNSSERSDPGWGWECKAISGLATGGGLETSSTTSHA